MCGKFTQRHTWPQIYRQLNAIANAVDVTTSTPMREAVILRSDEAGRREFVPMRWGFPEHRAKDPARMKHAHARAETIDELSTFAEAFRERRGILIVETFNEGEELPNGKTRQWTVRPRDGEPLGIAVIWERWENGPQTLECFVQVTTPANELIGRITDRMPAVLGEGDWATWLGEGDATPAQAKALLRTSEATEGEWELAPELKAGRPAKPIQDSLL